MQAVQVYGRGLSVLGEMDVEPEVLVGALDPLDEGCLMAVVKGKCQGSVDTMVSIYSLVLRFALSNV